MRVLVLGVSLVLTLGLAGSLGLMDGAHAASPSATTSSSAAPSSTAASAKASPKASASSKSSGLLGLLPSASSSPTKAPSKTASPKATASASASSSAAPTNKTGSFHPKPGVLFNDPYNRAPYKNDTIRIDAIKAINSAPPGSKIEMGMFNFKSVNYLNALIKAHQRGVQVQYLMCACNDTKALNNPQPGQLRTELKKGNAGLPKDKQSWVKECRGSCRGKRGINHYKFIAFSAVGAGTRPVKDVVMYGSNNATEVAVNQQWNDWYTYTGNARLYNDVSTVFEQAAKDTPVKNGFVQFNFMSSNPASSLWFYPYTGAKATGDPVLKKLDKVGCTGAKQKFLHGHTRVRIAQDAISGTRGVAIAQRLVAMEQKGCDVKIVYTLMGTQVKNILQRGGIHLVHYAYDRNGDGEYDMYLHAKDMAVEGVYNNDKSAYVTWNGTANWSPLPLISDEIVSEIHNRKTTIAYTQWINWLLKNRPSWWPASASTLNAPTGRARPDGTRVAAPRIDPYAKIRGDL